MPGICPSQSAGRLQGIVSAAFGLMQPANNDAMAAMINAARRGRLTAFMWEWSAGKNP